MSDEASLPEPPAGRPALRRKSVSAIKRTKTLNERLAAQRTPIRQGARAQHQEYEFKPPSELPSTHIDVDILQALESDFGMSLQWITEEIYGQPVESMPGYSTAAVWGNGWERVQVGDFEGVLDYLAGSAEQGRPIRHKGLVLAMRPSEIQKKARAWEKRQAAAALSKSRRMQVEGIDGVTGSHDPDVLRQNKLNVTREQIEVPR